MTTISLQVESNYITFWIRFWKGSSWIKGSIKSRHIISTPGDNAEIVRSKHISAQTSKSETEKERGRERKWWGTCGGAWYGTTAIAYCDTLSNVENDTQRRCYDMQMKSIDRIQVKICAYICIATNWRSNKITVEHPSASVHPLSHTVPWVGSNDNDYNDAAFFIMHTNDVLVMGRYCAVLLWCNCRCCCIIGIRTISVYGAGKSFPLFHWRSAEDGCRWSAWSCN